ncbi:ATP-binding protein [Paenibacillus daejeonensis]|uniref:GAF domain-containing sensor histidine kinase n=1 Tax=Paenibacillus daejeonensis TaxID=135193 RepID=UPI00036BEB5B|nr:ATP-binding protein [Paenibacillus daejeonensis]
MLKTGYIDVLSIVSRKVYDAAAHLIETASSLIPANTFCIANLDPDNTKVIKAFNREKVMLGEGLVVANEESYCALVTEHMKGPLVIENNLTHPLTKDMDATEFVGGCSFLGVPIIDAEGEMYGSLCAFDHEYYSYDPKDVELMVALSDFFTKLLEMEFALNQLRQAEEKVAMQMKEKSNLLAVLSHEIRTPMNGIIGMTSLLQSTDLTEEQKSYVDVIETSGSSLLSMMDQILTYSKNEAETIELADHPFQLSELFDYIGKLFTPEANRKGVQFTTELDANMTLIGDSNKFRQILINLIGNALKFTEQGQVKLTVHVEAGAGDTAVINCEVRDTGIGIPEDRHELLFRSFSQVHDEKASGKYSGAGLGLSICKQLAERMHGDVWLMESSSEGSCFACRIIMRQEQAVSV